MGGLDGWVERKIWKKNKKKKQVILLLLFASSSFPAKKIAPRLRLQQPTPNCTTQKNALFFFLNGLKMVEHDNVGQPKKKIECVVCDKHGFLSVLFQCRCFLEANGPGRVHRNAGREFCRSELDLTYCHNNSTRAKTDHAFK